MRVRLAAWAFACVALLSANAFAQQTTGTILGRILDSQGRRSRNDHRSRRLYVIGQSVTMR